MSWMDDELREALGRRTPPGGFAERVMERVKREPEQPAGLAWRMPPQRHWWRTAAIAASIAIFLTGGMLEYQRQRRERREAEVAKDQLVMALQLTAGKLHVARERIVGISYSRRPAREEE